MKKRLHIFWIVMLLCSMISCTPQKRLHRLLALHPELTTKETIHIHDSIFIPKTRIDTLIHENYLIDTVTLTKEKLSVKLLKTHDTVYVTAWHDPDTIIVEKEIQVEKIVNEIPQSNDLQEKWQVVKDILLVIVVFVIVGVLIGVLVKR